MSKTVGLAHALMLVPLLGVTDTLANALSFLGLYALIVALYAVAMGAVRTRLGAPARWVASLMLAASLVSSAQVLLQAFALPVYLQLSACVALISVQCIVLEYSGFFTAGQRTAQWRLFGLFGVLMVSMGLLRASTVTTLMPAGFILLGLLLAGYQAWAHYSKPR